jgi:hypothetical protein
MTGLALFLGLVPIMYSNGTGADVMKRVAAPMLGGVTSALILVLLVYTAIYAFWRGRGLPSGGSLRTSGYDMFDRFTSTTWDQGIMSYLPHSSVTDFREANTS